MVKTACLYLNESFRRFPRVYVTDRRQTGGQKCDDNSGVMRRALKTRSSQRQHFNALEVSLNDMRYINSRFTYLRTTFAQKLTGSFLSV